MFRHADAAAQQVLSLFLSFVFIGKRVAGIYVL